jgi:hypothetical protein
MDPHLLGKDLAELFVLVGSILYYYHHRRHTHAGLAVAAAVASAVQQLSRPAWSLRLPPP